VFLESKNLRARGLNVFKGVGRAGAPAPPPAPPACLLLFRFLEIADVDRALIPARSGFAKVVQQSESSARKKKKQQDKTREITVTNSEQQVERE
jgi:hypothetical protein